MLEALVFIIAVTISSLAGYWLRGSYRRVQPTRYRPVMAPQTDRILAQVDELSRDVDKHKLLVQRINDELHALEQGGSAATVNTTAIDSISKLIESNERMHAQLNSADVKLQEQAREIANHSIAARTDPLTKLANRRALDDAMAESHDAFVDRHQPTTVMMLDIDHFKGLNDNYGHQVGDEVLREVAQVLRGVVPHDQMVSRFGGEEFAIVFANTNLEDVVKIAEEVRVAIKSTSVEFSGLALKTSVSTGLAQFLVGESVSSLIGRADVAMYASKAAGRNCGHLHDGTTVVPLSDWPVGASQLVDATEQVREPEVGISTPEVFCSDVRRRISDFREGVAPLSVLFVAVDEMPDDLNEQGEEVRRAAVRAATLTVKAAMREMDHAARFEQDALSMLLPGCTLAGAMMVAERVRAAVARCELPARFGSRHFTVSLGVAEALEDEDEDQLIYRVRQSIAAARAHGRNCTYVHDGANCRLIGAGHVSALNG